MHSAATHSVLTSPVMFYFVCFPVVIPLPLFKKSILAITVLNLSPCCKCDLSLSFISILCFFYNVSWWFSDFMLLKLIFKLDYMDE